MGSNKRNAQFEKENQANIVFFVLKQQNNTSCPKGLLNLTERNLKWDLFLGEAFHSQ